MENRIGIRGVSLEVVPTDITKRRLCPFPKQDMVVRDLPSVHSRLGPAWIQGEGSADFFELLDWYGCEYTYFMYSPEEILKDECSVLDAFVKSTREAEYDDAYSRLDALVDTDVKAWHHFWLRCFFLIDTAESVTPEVSETIELCFEYWFTEEAWGEYRFLLRTLAFWHRIDRLAHGDFLAAAMNGDAEREDFAEGLWRTIKRSSLVEPFREIVIWKKL